MNIFNVLIIVVIVLVTVYCLVLGHIQINGQIDKHRRR